MRIASLIAITAVAAIATAASAKPDYPPGAEARQRQIMAHIGPRTRAWIAAEARRVARARSPTVQADVQGQFPNLAAGDIEELCFIVLMEATNDQDQDLEQIMAETKAQTNAKQGLRAELASNAVGGGDSGQVSEMGDMASLRLQMAMDRKSKLMEALSNLMKTIDATSETIIQNMK